MAYLVVHVGISISFLSGLLPTLLDRVHDPGGVTSVVMMMMMMMMSMPTTDEAELITRDYVV